LEEGREVSELRFVAGELEEDFRCVLQAARRDLAAFSSGIMVVRVGRVLDAMSDILGSF
jgi:hypothetical protein